MFPGGSLFKSSRLLSNRYLLRSNVSIQLLRQWLLCFLGELRWTKGNFLVLSCLQIFLSERDNFSKSNLFVFFLNPLITFFTIYESYVLVTKCSHGLCKLSSLSPNHVPFWQLCQQLYISHFSGTLLDIYIAIQVHDMVKNISLDIFCWLDG